MNVADSTDHVLPALHAPAGCDQWLSAPASSSAISLAVAEPVHPLYVANLLNDLIALGPLLVQAIDEGNWLDGFLIAAGINQIAEDYLHDSLYALDQATSLLGQSASPARRLAARIAAGTSLAARELKAPRRARALAWQSLVDDLVGQLARMVVADLGAPEAKAGLTSESLIDRCRQLTDAIPSLPAGLQRSVIRLPACFHDFDQRPEDLDRLAERSSDRWPPARPLLVVGVRTSGSYLGPLLAAAFRGRRNGPVSAMTIRPGRALLKSERALVRSVVAAGGQFLLTDDPPVTGSSLAAAARQLERMGVSRRTVVFALGLEDDSGALPAALDAYTAVTLRPREWSVEARLHVEDVRAAVAELLAGELELRSLERLPLPGPARQRGHRRALFRVSGLDAADRTARQIEVLASTVGVGYLGAHHAAVARALSRFSPRVLGLRDGMLYREWLPAHQRLEARSDEFAATVARYVAARRRTLSTDGDMSLSLAGQRPVWEVASLILARAFGRVAPLMRVVLVERLVRPLLAVSRPSVVDGSMAAEHWFTDSGDRRPVKVSLSNRTYWRLGLACFDPSFDLAGVGVSSPDDGLAAQVRAAWRVHTGEQVDPERWLLYELAHLWGIAREDVAREAEVRHASARAATRYFANTFLDDLEQTGHGPLCALDVDGVLETDQFGFPAPSRASATALRALVAHGYRPVIVTGRGLAEVRDRCRAYRLAGGVAEYGSALYLNGRQVATGLIGGDAATALSGLRALLREREGVQLDPAYSYAMRAYRIAADGRRQPLAPVEVAELLEARGFAEVIRAIPGDSQTDFVAAEVDKGTGLRALIAALEGDGQSRLPDDSVVSLAVGDTVADAPMLALGSAAFLPAHAERAATRTGARRLARPYQAGLYRAVGELLGHPPGHCWLCQIPPATPGRDLLLDLLSVGEDGRRGLAAGALRLAWRAVR
jgi:hydroxymethylpyrimidine pyrophosphatase-like HAD family hydrolase/adenine/guanine phosphoribosyltransferase-like PRPP-binding protein